MRTGLALSSTKKKQKNGIERPAVLGHSHGKMKLPVNQTASETKIEPFLTAALIFGGMLVSAIYLFDLYYLSRFIVFGTLGLYVLFEVVLLSGACLPLINDCLL